jgi:foldase protein PrsA
VAIAQGIGNPSVPSGDVAVVEDAPDGHISTEDFQRALKQAAAQAGLRNAPSPGDPNYAQVRDQAMNNLLVSRWVAGEAEDRGISVSESELSNRLSQIQQQYGGRQAFERARKQAGYSAEDVRALAEAQLLGNQIQQQILPSSNAPVSETQIKNFYEANKSQFTTPETRDVREIVNPDQAKVEQAKAQLEQDDSAANWNKVAAQFSTNERVIRGQNEPALDDQIFSAPQGQLVGPFKGQSNYYLIEVEQITPAEVQPLSKVHQQISSQLSQGRAQDIAQAFQADFFDKWISRTFCAEGYVMSRCENYEPPPPTCSEEQADKQGCPAPVTSMRPVAPGEAGVFPGQAAQGLPQGPQQPVSPAAQQPGVIGPSGAPQLPSGAAPQGTPTAP